MSKIRAIFVQNTHYLAELLRKILPVQITNQVLHLGIFYSWRIIFIDAGYQCGTSFNRNFDMKTTIFKKNVLTKKGEYNFQLSNGTNKSRAHFCETIPLMMRLQLQCTDNKMFHVYRRRSRKKALPCRSG
jgi:hypothetical protein